MSGRGCASVVGLLVVIFVVIAGVWLFLVPMLPSGSSEVSEPGSPSLDYAAPRAATIERVVDGDTVIVQLDGTSTRVRLLNIDTPESVKPDSPVECLGPETSAFLTQLLPAGTPVTLQFDLELYDQYDRMLAGLVTTDGSFVNATIARAGLAESVTYSTNDRFTAEVDAAVAEARSAGVGLWSGVCG